MQGKSSSSVVRAYSRGGQFFRAALSFVVLLVLSAVILWQHDFLIDKAALLAYHPPQVITQLAKDDAMTALGTRLFYVNKPVLTADKAIFNQHCVDPDEQVIVLGCYLGNRQGIYLYSVNDPQLAGVEQVTAAHEMLHQAYQRLSSGERTRVDKLLQQYYQTHTTPDLVSQIGIYHQTEPGDELDEMHSVIGTEMSDLPPALQTYYAHYLANQPKIAAYYQQYSAEFNKRKAAVTADDQQLAALKTQIEAGKTDLSAREQTLSSLRAQMNDYLAQDRKSVV